MLSNMKSCIYLLVTVSPPASTDLTQASIEPIVASVFVKWKAAPFRKYKIFYPK